MVSDLLDRKCNVEHLNDHCLEKITRFDTKLQDFLDGCFYEYNLHIVSLKVHQSS